LTHQRFLSELTGDTVIKFPAKPARCCKFFSPENGWWVAQMMPVTVLHEIGENSRAPARESDETAGISATAVVG
jgi:hypothetical protein